MLGRINGYDFVCEEKRADKSDWIPSNYRRVYYVISGCKYCFLNITYHCFLGLV